jgi:quercetin 2,3-dioxygenase
MNIRMDPGAVYTLPKASKGINRTLYFYEGDSIRMASELIPRYHAVEVNPEADILIENGDHKTRILILQGKPIGEPVIQYGPFVMNTKEEINQTFEDYHRNQFGGWPWPKTEQVHPREKGRFAKHSDGRLEQKS